MSSEKVSMKPFAALCLGMLFALAGCISREQSTSRAPMMAGAGTGGAQIVLAGRAEAQGPAGSAGPTGARGESGIAGTPGTMGARGMRGAQGAQGMPGAQGGRGERGEKGAVGAAGERGEHGEKGDAGPPGERGAKGEPGLPGKDAPDGIVAVPAPVAPPWLVGQKAHDDHHAEGHKQSDVPGDDIWTSLYHFLIGLSGLVTALSPLLLMYFKRAGRKGHKNRSLADIAYVCMPVVVLVLGAFFVAYLAVQFMQWLLIFICVYTLVVAIAFICYAYGRKVLAEAHHRSRMTDFVLRDKEMHRQHAEIILDIKAGIARRHAEQDGWQT